MYIIDVLAVGVLQANCYLFCDCKSRETIIIDPGDDAEKIIDVIETNSYHPIMIVDTHYHFDHICANRALCEEYSIPIAIGEQDAECLRNSHKDALAFMINCIQSPDADMFLKENDMIKTQNYEFNVIETPGHTKGSICLYSKKEQILFSGDTLFFESIGRWDLKGGNKNTLLRSLDKLLRLDERTTVYPGHGQTTTIAHEKYNNPFIKQKP